MDYLTRNIKDSYNQKTVLVQKTQGSSILFWAMVSFWTLAVIFWKLSH